MAKLNNKGFSLVELIIAISVFTFMIVPIISQLMVTMRIGDRSRALQEQSEYAQDIMEYFKSTPLDEIGQDNLFDGNNALQFDGSTTKKVTVGSATDIEYEEKTYSIPTASAVTIGKGKFYSKITLDTKEYALTQAGYRKATDAEVKDSSITKYPAIPDDGNQYIPITAMDDPNQTNVGNLTNLNGSKVAIIDGDASNSDVSAADAIFAMKAELMKNDGPTGYKKWEQLMYGGFSGFDNDNVTKLTRISLKKGLKGGKTCYTVTALVDYKDSNAEYPTTLPTYNVYQQDFIQKEPPVIYFMYNPCVYNGEYAGSDYILMDVNVTGLDPADEVKMYLIETRAQVPAGSVIEDILKGIKDKNGNQKYKTDLIEAVDQSFGRQKRDSVKTYFNVTSATDTSRLRVFTNKTLDLSGTHSDYVFDYEDFGGGAQIGPTGTTYKHPPINASTGHFIKPLSEDTAFEGRLYTMKVTLYNAADNSVSATYTGTRGAD